jgi:hypothetical protein
MYDFGSGLQNKKSGRFEMGISLRGGVEVFKRPVYSLYLFTFQQRP